MLYSQQSSAVSPLSWLTERQGPFAKIRIADAAGAIGAFAGDFVPEIVGNIPVALVPGHFIKTSGRDHLRYMRIHMQALEFIAMRREGIEETFLVEALGEPQILLLPGHRIQVGEHLAHAAVFHLQNALHLLFARGSVQLRTQPAIFSTVLKRLLVARKRVHIEMTRHDLVIGVERGPDIHAVAQTVEPLDRECAEIAVLALSLTFGQLGHHEVAVAL